MTGKTHAVASGMLGVMVSAKYDLHIYYAFICVLGGLLPDADMKKSYMGRFIPLWLICKPHRRNITHSFVGAIICTLPWLIHPFFAMVFFLGYLSHLLLDIFNTTGVPLWWPDKHMVTVANVKVGGLGELIVLFLFYIMVVAILSSW